MKRIRIVGLCLIAVFAFSAVAVANASAAEPPTYKACVKAAKSGKTYTGKYNDKACTEENATSDGRYELAPVTAGTEFTSKSKGATFTVGGKTVYCKKDADKGEFVGGGYSLETITFSDCEVQVAGKKLKPAVPCASAGEAPGTIKTPELLNALEYINAGETELGLVLVNGFSGAFLEFTCEGEAEPIVLEGALAGTISNLVKGKAGKGQTITFAVNGSGEQEPSAIWEGGSETSGVHLFTEPGSAEATLTTVDETKSKGIAAYAG